MIYAKPNNYGVDSKILEIQNYLFARLSLLWGGQIDVYGRIEKLTKNSECYISEKEYRMPFFNDNVNGSFAFDVTKYDSTTNLKADISLIGTVLIDKIFNDEQRNDQLAMLQVYNILKRMTGILEFDSFVTGQDALNGLNIKAPHREMHPWFVFAIKFKVVYKNNACTIN